MPRDLPLSNGSLHVNFDQAYQLRDLYWPHVGQVNHTAGHPFRFGVWVDGTFSWVAADGWQRTLTYSPGTLVTLVTLDHRDLQLRVVCQDAVDFHENLYVRQVTVHNLAAAAREVRLFFGQDFHIGGHEIGDSAYYEPERRALFHYKGRQWFLVNTGRLAGEEFEAGLDQWAVGVKEVEGKEGTWRDAEDGELSKNAVAQGSVDSCAALHLSVAAQAQATGWYWIAAGADFEAVTRLNRSVRHRGAASFIERTRHYWALWLSKEHEVSASLPPALTDLYRASLLIVRTQIDHQGAILAANDFDITHFARDTYAYMWPRDGALVAAALDAAGYAEVARRFFDFCHRVITPEGYFLHKYNPDGSLASSWHGWYQAGHKELPVQEDETALVLWALGRHFERYRDVEFIKPLYRGLIIRAANWLDTYRDPADQLPLPSWDLWEERRGVLAWTCAATWAGLQAGARFAAAFGEPRLADRFQQAAGEIRAGVEQQFWRPEMGRFARLAQRAASGWEFDTTVDASLIGLWYFGMFPPDDPRIVSTLQAIQDHLRVRNPVGGVARYERDPYQQVDGDPAQVPGNPWFICTLWLAQWYIARAQGLADLQPALDLLHWTARHTLPSGVMAEQVHPYSQAPLSVSPLTWSHATLILTMLEYQAQWARLSPLPAGSAAPNPPRG